MAKKRKKGRSSPKSVRRKARKRRIGIQQRRKKAYAFRGYSLEELQEMTLEQFSELLTARARRSLRRGLSESQQTFLQNLRKKEGLVRTHHRDLIILPEMVDREIAIYDGREFRRVTIQPEMLGHYLGEFALTRRSVKHTGPGVGATRSSKYMPLK